MTTDATITNIDHLLDEVLKLSVPLHASIADFDEPGARYELAGVPGVALFERDHADVISHVSSSPSPALMEAIDDLRRRHLAAANVAEGVDNSHLPSLLMMCMFLVEPGSKGARHLRDIAVRPAVIAALDEEAGKHDPDLEPHDAALRAWTPLLAGHAPEAGVHPAILELRFAANRYTRYVP
ncbi:MAG: hypothetical protein H7123_04435 [Thermoleophilia bacterium]|nr:hypothetical protein [Thermoleophilia bacterium]